MTRVILLCAAIIVAATMLLVGGIVDPKHGAAPNALPAHAVADAHPAEPRRWSLASPGSSRNLPGRLAY